MESTETIDDSLDSKSLEASVEDVVAKYEDCSSEVLSSQNEEDQSGEQVYGYLEVRSPGSEDATIYLDSQGFNLNGQRLILTQNDEGNGIIVVVSEDPDGQPLEQTFAHASVLHSDEVNFEDGLKEHGALVDEQSQSLEFIETEEVSQEHEERHVYIENSGGIINISTENQCSPVNPVNIESPLWSVSNNTQLKNDSTEMLFIPNPTVVLAPEETKHRKLMQLACIAHELQSADQKSNIAAVGDGVKDTESLFSEFENSVIVTQNDVEKNSKASLALPSSESDKCSLANESDVDFNTKSAKSVDVTSPVSSCTSAQAVDNAVSVIHTTSSEVQENSLENSAKQSSSSDLSSLKNSENELPTEILCSSNASRVLFLDATKQLDNCSRDGSEENRLSMSHDSNDCKKIKNNNGELILCSGDDDSPITFIEKSEKLDVGTLNIEVSPLDDANAEVVMDNDNHPGSCIAEEKSKGIDEESDMCVPGTLVMKDIGINQRKNKVPSETEFNGEINNKQHCISTSKNELSTATKYNAYNYKSKAKKLSSGKNSVLSSISQGNVENIAPVTSDEHDLSKTIKKQSKDDSTKIVKNSVLPPVSQDSTEKNISETNCYHDGNKANIKQSKDDSTKIDENNRSKPMDTEILDSDLLIAENDDDFRTCIKNSNPSKSKSQNFESGKISESSSKNVEMLESKNLASANETNSFDPDFETFLPLNTKPVSTKESNENGFSASLNFECSAMKDNEDFSNNEETLVKPPKKTYIRKKVKKNIVESKSAIREKIELFSVEDFNFSECDKEINDVENSLNFDQQKENPSSQDNAESDDHLLLSDVQSKVSATYNRKKKSIPPKQGLWSRSLRPRLLPSKLPLESESSEVSLNASKKKIDSNISENLPWGDVLLKTSFQPCNDTNDAPSTSFASDSLKETLTPVLSPEQRRRKLNKYTRDFDRLLNSSPVAAKRFKLSNKKRIPRGRKKVIRARQSNVFSSTHYSEFFETNKSLPVNSLGLHKSTVRKRVHAGSQKPKEATIRYLNREPPQSEHEESENFSCSSCNFLTKYVDNLIEHLKYCSNRQPVLDYRVNDMDKRQRIRGEDTLRTPEEVSTFVNGSLKEIRNNLRSSLNDEEPPLRLPNQDAEEADLDFLDKRTQYGYGEDDVVWVKFKDRFWPALVCDIKGVNAYVKLISYPKEVKGLKVKHENIRTFDDFKWNLLCLTEAENLPNKEIFVKAVQSSELFMRRKFLGFQVRGKEFFSVRDGVDFATDSASSDSIINEDSDSEDAQVAVRFPPPARKARYETLNIEKILHYILDGETDEHVLNIYYGRWHSKKHLLFFDEAQSSNLKHRPWFGPCEEKSQQERLVIHFRELFLEKIGEESYLISYVCQVWIPEALVKAISVIQDIPMRDAEILFESEDSLDEEPSS